MIGILTRLFSTEKSPDWSPHFVTRAVSVAGTGETIQGWVLRRFIGEMVQYKSMTDDEFLTFQGNRTW